MTLEAVPWFIKGGNHNAESARTIAYAASGRNEGVVGSADFKVTASEIPDGNVHIAPGALVALNQFAGGDSQAYIVRNVGDQPQALDPQGSSGVRYDLVAVIVEDPFYPGQPDPVDTAEGPFVRVAVYKDVAATARKLAEVDVDQSGYAVARVKFDASDGTVTESDITDLRGMLFSQSKTVTRMQAITAGTVAMDDAAAVFPTGAEWEVEVPPWANKVQLSAIILGVDLLDNGADGGTASGKVRVDLDALQTPLGSWQVNAVGPGKRTNATIGAADDSIDVPEAMRGQTAELSVKAYTTALSNMVVNQRNGTTAIVTATFSEVVE